VNAELDDSLDDGRMTLVEHLTELRTRLIRAALAVAVGAIVCWFAYDWIFEQLAAPYCDLVADDALRSLDADGDCAFLVREPLESFSVRLTVAGYGGVALAVPVVLWQLWRFISPGLYPHEKRHAVPFVLVGSLLFVAGAALAYWSMPRALEFLADLGGPDFVNAFSPAPYLGFVIKMMVGFGIGFEFPLVLTFLQLIGVLDNRTLRRSRRFALVAIVVLGAVLTPSGDPFTLLVLSVPLYLLFELSILIGWWHQRRRARLAA
jgi:sec-independent protein translocase protein TatC